MPETTIAPGPHAPGQSTERTVQPVQPVPPDPPDQAVPIQRSLSWKLGGAAAALTLVAVAAFSLIVIRQHQKHIVDEFVRGAALFSDTVRASTREEMMRGQMETTYRVMEGIAHQKPVSKLRIFDSKGKVTFSTLGSEAGHVLSTDAVSCRPCHGGAAPAPAVQLSVSDRARIYETRDGERILEMVTPVYNEPSCSEADCHAHPPTQRVLGLVEVGLSLASADRELAQIARRTAFLAAATVLIVAFLVALSVRHWVTLPVRDLVGWTQRIAEGRYKGSVPARSDDELGVLTRSFSEMATSLAKTRAERLALLEGLEKTVEERTAALKAAQASLLQTEKLASVGRLSASIAHEINNPLAGILTFAKVLTRTLEDGTPDEPARQKCLRNLSLIAREAERCRGIVRNLLDFARERPIDVKEVDVNAALEESVQLSLHRIQIQGITLVKSFEPGLVSHGDYGQLRQALLNVVLNACDAMADGGTLTLVSRREPKGGGIEVSVTDTGRGIPPEALGKIFDPFFTTKEMGTGLGLSVVYGIVEKHGGRMEVSSEVGRGTTMRITLPSKAPPGGTA